MTTSAREAIRCPKCEGASIFAGYCCGEEYRFGILPEDSRRCTAKEAREHLHRTCICGFEWLTDCADAAKTTAAPQFSIGSQIAGNA